jgi:hypothetical protein
MEPMKIKTLTSITDEPASMTELVAFAGKGDYPKDWEKYHERKSSSAGFNGWAFIFGMQWFFYRKLYLEGVISILFEIGIPVGFVLLVKLIFGHNIPAQYDRAIPYCAVVLCFLVRIAIGYWANIALYKKATKTIQKINQLNLDNDTHLTVIKNIGEPSFQSVLLLYVGIAIVKIGVAILQSA